MNKLLKLSKLSKLIVAILVVFVISIVGTFSFADHFFNSPCLVTIDNSTKVNITFEVVKGASIKKVAYDLQRQKIIKTPRLFYLLAHLYNLDRGLKAGEYLIDQTTTPKTLLENIIQGKVIQYPFTAIEGWNINQLLVALKSAQKIKQTLEPINKENLKQEYLLTVLAQNLNLKEKNPEGLFLPDTYYYTKDMPDIALLKRMNKAQEKFLQQEWNNKKKEIILKTPYEVLVLASIVERETALVKEMPMVAGVYLRRLASGMRLQADPTVIYGLGSNFNGTLKKSDLEAKTQYNTYTNIGLPPTPIAMPSRAAIKAVLNPDDGDSLYFVANGKGGHVFSSTLEAHNKAVADFRAEIKKNNVVPTATTLPIVPTLENPH